MQQLKHITQIKSGTIIITLRRATGISIEGVEVVAP
jgi:hypothetical protein